MIREGDTRVMSEFVGVGRELVGIEKVAESLLFQQAKAFYY